MATAVTKADPSGGQIWDRLQELKEEITKNDFFNYKADYPPEKEDDPGLVAYSLVVTIGDKTHTTAWTKNSKGIPDGITTIVDAIRRIAAKENVV